MYIIGISAYYHDSSICLFKNEELIFAIEEEKFTGIKHDASFPHKSLEYIIDKYKIKRDEIDMICYYEDPKLKRKRVILNGIINFFKSPVKSIKSFSKINSNLKDLTQQLKKYSDNIFYSEHHKSHIYYSHSHSNYDESVCFSIDGVGEFDTTSVGYISGDEFQYKPISEYPHSLGLFYAAMTAFLGFKPNEGEYKVMGLASYGNPNLYFDRMKNLITYREGKLECNMKVFNWDRSERTMFNDNLEKIIGLKQRIPDEEITEHHKNLAASVQKIYEKILFDIIYENRNPNISTITLGGGCAYNGSANGKILKNFDFKNLWIPPAPSDAGSCIGACVNYIHQTKGKIVKVNQNPFLGPSFIEDDIEMIMENINHKKFETENNLIEYVSKKLYEGKVVGWFQGSCEFGARALGHRSILANPTIEGMKDRINSLVKKREGFRPFAPSVIKESQTEFFELLGDVPYMNQVVQVKSEYKNIFNSTTHVDGSARVHTVYEDTLFHELLKEFGKLSGLPVLLNTSFNIKDKTMVLTPQDAINTFNDVDIDLLIINNYLIEKK
jgi:carbamoyltransferase